MLAKVKGVLTDQKGVLSEYGLLIALVAVACIVALGFLGRQLVGKFHKVGEEIQKAEPIQ
ncbi:MAG: Flp family type IVb pilin [Desulfotomaculales bacterium]